VTLYDELKHLNMNREMIKNSIIAFINITAIFSSLLVTSCKKESDQPTVPEVVTLPISDTSYTTAACGGNILSDGGAAITSCGICWSTGTTPTLTDNRIINSEKEGEFASSMTNLQPGKIYYVRAFATNKIGTGYGETLTFSTKTPPTKGTLIGSILLSYKYGYSNIQYNDVRIELIDSTNKSVVIYPNSDGKFRIDDLPLGNISLVIDKPGYGIFKSGTFRHSKSVDTLSTTELVEELPFSFSGFQVNYSNKILIYNDYTDYVTTDSYMVTNLLCFSKSPDVSINNCSLLTFTGSFTNVAYINSVSNASVGLSFDQFLNKGFKSGDVVYAIEYPVTQKYFDLYYGQSSTFKQVSFKFNNLSNICQFILQQ
jgi:hypothetical protein